MSNEKFRWSAVAEKIDLSQDKIIGCELGIWKGKMSQKLLELIPNLHLIMVDRWECPPPDDSFYQSGSQIALVNQEVFDAAFEEAMERTNPYASRCDVYRMLSVQAAAEIKDDSLDFVFIDGDHSYEGVKADIQAWYPKVKEKSWISGHDWGKLNKGNVEKAVREFFNDKFELGCNSTWFVQKVG